jgi:hypothetical protein
LRLTVWLLRSPQTPAVMVWLPSSQVRSLVTPSRPIEYSVVRSEIGLAASVATYGVYQWPWPSLSWW